MRILILDDHPLFANALSQTVSRLEHQVNIDFASDTKQAFHLIDFGKNYDLILVDLKLKGLDGFGFMRILSDNFITSPVIVISSNQDIKNIEHAYKLGAMGFIHKSAQANEILDAIRQVLSGKIYQPDNIKPIPKETDIDSPSSTSITPKTDNFGISNRQFSVLQLITTGLSNKEIARELDISESTVKTHVSSLISALAVHNRTACVTEAQRLGLL